MANTKPTNKITGDALEKLRVVANEKAESEPTGAKIETPDDAPHFEHQRLNDCVWNVGADGNPEFDRARNLANLADLLAMSGYFGQLTPAQIAVQILAGAEMGFSPVAAMFNLEMGLNKIALDGGAAKQPRFLKLIYNADIQKMILDVKADQQLRETGIAENPAAPGELIKCDLCKREFNAKDKFPYSIHTALNYTLHANFCSETCRETVQNARVQVPPEIVKCPVCFQSTDALTSVATYNGEKIEVCSAKCSREIIEREKFRANAGVLSLPNEKDDTQPAQPAETTADAAKIETAPAISSIGNVVSNVVETVMPKPAAPAALPTQTKPADDFAAIDALEPMPSFDELESDAKFGAAQEKAIKQWRKEIKSYCDELGLPTAEKIKKFNDFIDINKKRDMATTVKKYYSEQTEKLRTFIAGVFDGNDWLESGQPDKSGIISTGSERAGYINLIAAKLTTHDFARMTYADLQAIKAALQADKMI